MLPRLSTYEWLSTSVAFVALIVSATSAYFSWQTNHAKQDALRIGVRPAPFCKTQYQRFSEAGFIGLCWTVTLANESENRLSIVESEVFRVESGGKSWFGGFQDLETDDGNALNLPITLDGGEARKIVVRGAVMVPPAVALLIAQMSEFQGHVSTSLPLDSVQQRLALANIDFVGNKVDPMLVDGKFMGFSISSPVKTAVNVLSLTTGRGAKFHARLAYPPDIEGVPVLP